MHAIYGAIALSDNLRNDTLRIHKSVEQLGVAYMWRTIFWRGLFKVEELREDRISNTFRTDREATKNHECPYF